MRRAAEAGTLFRNPNMSRLKRLRKRVALAKRYAKKHKTRS